MLPIATRTSPTRRNLYAGLGAAVLGAAALVATISAVDSAADAVLGAADAVTQDAGPVEVPLLASVQVPPAPTTCPPASLDERARDVAALQQAQAAEQQAISSGSPQLADVRSQGQAAVARIQALDAGCPAG
jgi:hypothetical protein